MNGSEKFAGKAFRSAVGAAAAAAGTAVCGTHSLFSFNWSPIQSGVALCGIRNVVQRRRQTASRHKIHRESATEVNMNRRGGVETVCLYILGYCNTCPAKAAETKYHIVWRKMNVANGEKNGIKMNRKEVRKMEGKKIYCNSPSRRPDGTGSCAFVLVK